jgi:predicted dehydrogenase
MWLGPAPVRPYNEILSPRGVHTHFPMWRKYREYGGGMVTDWGAHHIDITQWGLGADDSGPVEIIPPADWQTAQAGAKLKYADGVEVTHIVDNGVTFFGSEGEVFVNRGKFKLTLKGVEKAKFIAKEDKPSLNDQLDAVEKEFLANKKVSLYASNDHKQDFLDAIKKRSRPICDVEIGARSIIACHLLNLAYYHGKTIQWDPKKIDFKGEGDKSWLTREYRGSWKVA